MGFVTPTAAGLAREVRSIGLRMMARIVDRIFSW